MNTTRLAVNGTLMRGLELNPNLTAVGAVFVETATTAPCYRLWSINDAHPAMIRVTDGTGTAVALEVWDVPNDGIATVLGQEPAGLSIGKVLLADGSEVLGVLGEPFLVEDKLEITEFGGWRAYTESKNREG
jgi:hypothetical protein